MAKCHPAATSNWPALAILLAGMSRCCGPPIPNPAGDLLAVLGQQVFVNLEIARIKPFDFPLRAGRERHMMRASAVIEMRKIHLRSHFFAQHLRKVLAAFQYPGVKYMPAEELADVAPRGQAEIRCCDV